MIRFGYFPLGVPLDELGDCLDLRPVLVLIVRGVTATWRGIDPRKPVN